MNKSVKILVIKNAVEASLLDEILSEKGIPHMIKPYHDSAYDGLWQTSSAWGQLYSDEQYKVEILKIYAEMSLPENQIDPL